MKKSEKNFIIVGIGNVYRGDDGAGVLVARFLRGCFGDRVKIIDYDLSFEELLEMWENFDVVILIDSIAPGGRSGDVYKIEIGQEFQKFGELDLKFFSTHSIGIAEYIRIAQALGKLPKKFIIYGIVGGNFNIGASISSEVKLACKKLIPMILAEIQN